jgi:hypothetical protein
MMPLAIRLTDRGAAPVIICDFCGGQIENASDGNYEWDGEDYRNGTLHEVFFVHKETCSHLHERQRGKLLDSMELDVLLPFMAANLGVEWDHALKRAAYFAQPLGRCAQRRSTHDNAPARTTTGEGITVRGAGFLSLHSRRASQMRGRCYAVQPSL